MSDTAADYILQMRNIVKIYPNGFAANKGINLDIRRGEIHALAGENGAGKTTLMNILFGFEDCQEGQIVIKGRSVSIKNPLDAIAHGVGMVHQHFMQIPKFTAAENIVLGIEPNKGLLFDKKKAIELSQDIADKYHFDIKVDGILDDLSIGQRQKVELLKVLIRGVDVLILDEPTAVLTPQETEELFVQLKKLKENDISIVFISHKLEEIMQLCDRITVLRRGASVGTDLISNLNEAKIARMMVGRDVGLTIKKEIHAPKEKIAEINDIAYVDNEGRRMLSNLSFNIKAGEIVGIAGVEGNGQQQIADLLSGIIPVQSGSIRIMGTEIKGKSIRRIRELGVAYISEDRMKYGCAPDLSVRDNIVADRIYRKEFRRGLFLDRKKIEQFVDECIRDFTIACDNQTAPVKFLSGGNIQKVVVAREFTSGARLIIANQPTRGIDVGTTEMIRKNIVKMAKNDNIAVLLVSSDLNEILEVSDRLFIIRKGKFVAHLKDTQKVSEELLGEFMLGVQSMSAQEMGAEL